MSEYRLIKTYRLANWICFFVGMSIVGGVSHSWLALFGVWVASLHFTRAADRGVEIA